MSTNKPKMKRYVSKERGKFLAFGPNKKLIGQRRLIGDEAPTGLSNPDLKGIKFSSANTKKYLFDDGAKFRSFFETNNPVLQDFIENHDAYKGAFIFNEPTPEEMAEKQAQAEQQRDLEKYRLDYAAGMLGEIDEKRKPEALKLLAGRIGAEITDKDGKELSTKQIAANIVKLLDVKTVEPKTVKKDVVINA